MTQRYTLSNGKTREQVRDAILKVMNIRQRKSKLSKIKERIYKLKK